MLNLSRRSLTLLIFIVIVVTGIYILSLKDSGQDDSQVAQLEEESSFQSMSTGEVSAPSGCVECDMLKNLAEEKERFIEGVF